MEAWERMKSCSAIVMIVRERLASNWEWVVVVMSWVLFFNLYGFMFSYGILFLEFQAEFESSATFTGWAGSIPIGLSTLLAPTMKVIIDRFSYRPVAVVAHIMATLGIVTSSFVPNMSLVYLTYSLMYGCGAGGLTLVVLGLLVRYFPSRKCVRAIAFTLSGSSIGMLSFAPLLRMLIDRFGWRTTLQIIGSMNFIFGIPCIATLVPPSSENEPSVKDQRTDEHLLRSKDVQTSIRKLDKHQCPEPLFQRDETGSGVDQNNGVLENYLSESVGEDGNIPRDKSERIPSDNSQHSFHEGDTTIRGWLRQVTCYPELYFISVAVTINGVIDCFYFVNMVSYMVSLGFTEKDGALFLSIMGASTAVGKTTLSIVGEWLPFPTYYTMVIASVVSCMVMCCFLVIKNLTVMYLLAAVIGGVMMTTTTVMTLSIPNCFFGPELSRQTWPVILFCNGIGVMCGSIVGQSIDRTGSYQSAIYAFTGLYIIVSLLLIAAPLYQRRFAPHRYLVQELHRKKRVEKNNGVERDASEKPVNALKLSGTSYDYEMVCERMSSV